MSEYIPPARVAVLLWSRGRNDPENELLVRRTYRHKEAFSGGI
jgi:hypothetical protein